MIFSLLGILWKSQTYCQDRNTTFYPALHLPLAVLFFHLISKLACFAYSIDMALPDTMTKTALPSLLAGCCIWLNLVLLLNAWPRAQRPTVIPPLSGIELITSPAE